MVAKKSGRKVKGLRAKAVSPAKAKTVKGGVGQVGGPHPNLGSEGWIEVSPKRGWGQ